MKKVETTYVDYHVEVYDFLIGFDSFDRDRTEKHNHNNLSVAQAEELVSALQDAIDEARSNL